MYYLCVNVYYCHRVTTQLQLTSIPYHIISYHKEFCQLVCNLSTRIYTYSFIVIIESVAEVTQIREGSWLLAGNAMFAIIIIRSNLHQSLQQTALWTRTRTGILNKHTTVMKLAANFFFRNFVKAWKSYWMKKGILTVVHTLVSDVTWMTLRRHSRMLLALHSYFDGISYDKKFLLRPLFFKKEMYRAN